MANGLCYHDGQKGAQVAQRAGDFGQRLTAERVEVVGIHIVKGPGRHDGMLIVCWESVQRLFWSFNGKHLMHGRARGRDVKDYKSFDHLVHTASSCTPKLQNRRIFTKLFAIIQSLIASKIKPDQALKVTKHIQLHFIAIVFIRKLLLPLRSLTG